VQRTQVDINRLVRMTPPGVLNRVRIDGQLVGMSKGYRITVLDAQHFREEQPTRR
jgi:hypothetical protein